MVGRTIGKYRIVEQIGKGGMGTVYGAIDETLDRRVAIKVLNADLIDQDSVERFRREAMTLARLNHGKIGAIHELTREGHDLLMVMEFLEGETFEKMIIEHGPLPIPRAVFLCGQILDALQYAHQAGVVHRDLKPANIILTPAGDVKVMDFGIARVQGSEHLTTAGFMVGTPAYMAPEQVRGEEVDPRMDLYSLTVVLYRMLTQRLPFSGDTAIAMIHSQLNNPPTPPSQYRADLPDWLVKILDRGLSKAPADRFQTAKEFRAALESGLTGKLKIPTGVIRSDAVAGVLAAPSSATTPVPPSVNAPAPSGTGVGPQPTGNVPSVAASVGNAGASGGTGAIATPDGLSPSPPNEPVLPASKTEKTVVLRTPQLATAGALFALLVIGIGVLAFIALRRPATPATSPDQTAVQTIPPADGSVTVPSGDAGNGAGPGNGATTPTAGTSAPATPATKSVTPVPAASATPAIGRAATTPTPAASGARGTTPSTAPVAATSSTPPTASASAASASLASAASAATSGHPPLPAAASAPAENFGDVRALVVDGNRSREVDALLSLEPGNLVVRSKSDGSVLRTLSYGSIGAATYARGRRPRGQSVADVAAVPENVGGSGFLGGARHWLTLQAPSEFLIVRLEDRNVIRVLNSIEARTGIKVMRNQSE